MSKILTENMLNIGDTVHLVNTKTNAAIRGEVIKVNYKLKSNPTGVVVSGRDHEGKRCHLNLNKAIESGDWVVKNHQSHKPRKQQLLIKPINSNFKAPVYGSLGAAAFDIRTPVDITLSDLEPVTVRLGFAAKVPDGHVAIVAPRSGLGSNDGIGLRNTIGVIDSDYTGEWRATLTMDMFNNKVIELGEDFSEIKSPSVKFNEGDRILQCMILPVEQVDFVITDELPETERGEGGYGSTGVK